MQQQDDQEKKYARERWTTKNQEQLFKKYFHPLMNQNDQDRLREVSLEAEQESKRSGQRCELCLMLIFDLYKSA